MKSGKKKGWEKVREVDKRPQTFQKIRLYSSCFFGCIKVRFPSSPIVTSEHGSRACFWGCIGSHFGLFRMPGIKQKMFTFYLDFPFHVVLPMRLVSVLLNRFQPRFFKEQLIQALHFFLIFQGNKVRIWKKPHVKHLKSPTFFLDFAKRFPNQTVEVWNGGSQMVPAPVCPGPPSVGWLRCEISAEGWVYHGCEGSKDASTLKWWWHFLISLSLPGVGKFYLYIFICTYRLFVQKSYE